MIGPGLVMGASAIGGGEWLAGPAVTAKYGGALLWVATVSIVFQVIYNIEISRYTLYTGEPIFTGKFRIPPHPMFWLVVYLLLDWGSIFPYLVTNAAVPLEAIILQRLPEHETNRQRLVDAQVALHGPLSAAPRAADLRRQDLQLAQAGDVVQAGRGHRVPALPGHLLRQAVELGRHHHGLFKVGNVPVLRARTQRQRRLDPGEDFDGDGQLDVDESVWDDTNGDGKPDGGSATPRASSSGRTRTATASSTATTSRTSSSSLQRPRFPRGRSVADRDDRGPGGDRRQRRPDQHADQQLHPRPGLGHGRTRSGRFPASSAATASRSRTSAACSR